MKKLFLLSLLSVLFLSAFSQITPSKPEILERIEIFGSADDDSGDAEVGIDQRGFWILFYKNVKTIYLPGWGVSVTCTGWGWKACIAAFPNLWGLWHYIQQTGLDAGIVENMYNSLYEECASRAGEGDYQGSVTKKLAFLDARQGYKESYLLFTMNWDIEQNNPQNCKAEIIISTTNSLGF